jgi:hypothetical protein
LAEHPTCQHYHRVQLDQATREDIEPKFEDLNPSAGFKFDSNGLLQRGPAHLTLADAETFCWCPDGTHIIVTWDVEGAPLDTAFYDEDLAATFLKKFGPSSGTCQHHHRVGIDPTTRKEIEPNFKGLNISAGFRLDPGKVLREARLGLKVSEARMFFWCADCTHVIVTWDIGGTPFDAAFYNKKATADLMEKFAV